MMKRTLLFFLLFHSVYTALFSFISKNNCLQKHRSRPSSLMQVMGALMPGAKGAYSYEDDICLAVSLKLGKSMRKNSLISRSFIPALRMYYRNKEQLH